MKENRMSLEDLSMYIEDLIRMGFVSQHEKGGRKFYKLTPLGKKSGLVELPQKIRSKSNTSLQGNLIK